MSSAEHESTPRRGLDLAGLTRLAEVRDTVRREELRAGEWIVVRTKNSRYLVGRDASGHLMISGGWFDQTGESPSATEIRGCTFGGRAIWTEILAAPGLFLEFENGVRTTRIQEVRRVDCPTDQAAS